MLMRWWRRQYYAGLAVFSLSMAGFGVSLSAAATGNLATGPVEATRTGTTTMLVTQPETRFVTVHVRGKILRRYDHVLVVYVPRVVFHTHTTPRRRVVVPAHVVRIAHRPSTPISPEQSLVVGVSPPPVTVTVPVTVDIPVPGPTTTVTGPTTTVTAPPTTITVPTTITLPVNSSTSP